MTCSDVVKHPPDCNRFTLKTIDNKMGLPLEKTQENGVLNIGFIVLMLLGQSIGFSAWVLPKNSPFLYSTELKVQVNSPALPTICRW